MRAYKFKGAHQIPHAFDIIFNSRLYCADWSSLNDPMEGGFATSRGDDGREDYKETVANIIREKKRLRVCSLSETFDCHLLWAHYASGFSGLAIEVELPNGSEAVKNVRYRGVFEHVHLDGEIDAQKAAEEILSSKYKEWQYEREIRVLHRDTYFPLASPVRRVIVGHRMEGALFDALNFMCHKKGIQINRTGIGDTGIDADYVEPPTERSPLVTLQTQSPTKTSSTRRRS